MKTEFLILIATSLALLTGCGRNIDASGRSNTQVSRGSEVYSGRSVIYDRGGVSDKANQGEIDDTPQHRGTIRTPNSQVWNDESGSGIKPSGGNTAETGSPSRSGIEAGPAANSPQATDHSEPKQAADREDNGNQNSNDQVK